MKRVDRTQSLIVKELRRAGCFVQSLADLGKGAPDLLVLRQGQITLMECKDEMQPPSKQRLTPLEAEWHAAAAYVGVTVHIVKNPMDALRAIGAIR